MGVNLRRMALALLAVAALTGVAQAADESPPEPAGYWNGPMLGPVPDSIAGGTVIGTSALAELIRTERPVLIDVLPAQRRPEAQAKGSPWMPLPHRGIAGSVWIPGAGNGTMPAPMAAYLRQRLRDLTRNDPDRPIVLYCRSQCWLSWNAARRTLSEGYRRVFWYPEGIEAWQSAGLPTEIEKAEGPEADTEQSVPRMQGEER